ncbi:MAG: box helicase family protein [Moraxellaceae bacterium]|jgi:Rad3-related DNA helicase|nr:box helicase family protein [Moraxellaceae bacterium]
MNYTISVRELVEFTAKTGDLDLRFTPAPTAQEGIEGHRIVASRRGPGYRAEVPLKAEFGTLSIRGRCDGYDPGRRLLEEVKTHRGDLARLPDNQRALHWAQARLYGAMLCASEELEALDIALVYFDIGSQKETVLTEHFTAWELQAFFHEHCTRFLKWAEQEMAHRRERDQALVEMRFPHPDFRHGQRILAEGVYRAARDGECLLAQAPTGIGKTIGTLFPLLKACPGQQIDRVFFLTAKTPGRALALEALQRLQTANADAPAAEMSASAPSPPAAITTAEELLAPATVTSTRGASSSAPAFAAVFLLRVLELTARDKACVHPDKECHGASCPLARGFYDRLPAARAAAVTAGFVDQPALQRLAQDHQVCPYYLSQEMARWSDVVVGDYNYFFDGSALLHSLTISRDWKVSVLADEAHNLIDRARDMYSAELHQAQLAALRKSAPRALKRPLGRLQKAWDALQVNAPPWQCLEELPAEFTGALQGAIAKIADYQTGSLAGEKAAEKGADSVPVPDTVAAALSSPAPAGDPSSDKGIKGSDTFFASEKVSDPFINSLIAPDLLRFYFDALHFQNLLDTLGPHSFIDLLTPPRGAGRALRIRNVVPAPHLRPRIAACHSLTLFSATLTPPELHRDLLGLPADTRFLDVPSPFTSEQLEVRIADHISTRYAHREGSLAPIAELMATQYHQAPGNYLAFFSSHDYLQRALAAFRAAHPDIPVREQSRAMDEGARAAFLAGFGAETRGIAFAVLGGAFGEGIDLPGARLIGAFVATLGLPQVNEVTEKIRDCLQAQFGAGYDYAYLYPGIQKVVQAAGRVIRTVEDQGVVHLIDDRFRQGKIRRLLPSWWSPTTTAHAKA